MAMALNFRLFRGFSVNVDQKTALIKAVQEKNQRKALKLIQDNRDLDGKDSEGRSALMFAVTHIKDILACELIKAGADVNITNNNGQTALFYAVQSDKRSVVEQLIFAGANVNTTDIEGKTALHYAAQYSNEVVVRELIAAHADVNIADDKGRTALFYAVAYDKENLVPLLVNAGVDINQTDNAGKTAIFYAVIYNRENITYTLINAGADVKKIDSKGKNALIYVSTCIHDKDSITRVSRALIEAGVDIDVTDVGKSTALMYAVQNNKENVVSALIDAGVDVNITDNEGKTALFYAVQNETEKVACALIAAGADVNITDVFGTTALINAINNEMESLSVALMKAPGANVNIADGYGLTALMYAVIKNKENVVETAIQVGADVNTTDNENKTALFYAIQNENNSVISMLIKAGVDIDKWYESFLNRSGQDLVYFKSLWGLTDCKMLKDMMDYVKRNNIGGKTALIYAVQNKKEIVAHALIDGGADVNLTDDEGKTALMYAIKKENESVATALSDVIKTANEDKRNSIYASTKNGNEGVVYALINANADVNMSDNEGKTALSYAVENDNESMARVLIDAGADLNLTDNEGETALIYAIKNGLDIFAYLIQKGADVNKTINEGRTALSYAIENEKEVVLQELIDAGADLNITDENGKSALINTIGKNLEGLACNMIEKGADVHTTDSKGKTGLVYAVQSGKEIVVRALLKAGADSNVADNDGKTALFYAVQNHCDGMLTSVLIEDGKASVNIKDFDGRTPLFYAITKSLFLARYLLNNGANPNITDNCNGNILSFFLEYCLVNDIEQSQHIFEGINLLIEYGFKTTTAFMTIINSVFCNSASLSVSQLATRNSVHFKALCEVLKLAKYYLDKNQRKEDKFIEDMLATMKKINNTHSVFKHLLPKILEFPNKLGVDPNSADCAGNTVLHHATRLLIFHASEETAMEICHKLEQIGVNFNAKNSKGETPLLFCLSSETLKMLKRTKGKHTLNEIKILVRICDFLLKHGGSVNEFSQDGETVFHLIVNLFQIVLIKVYNKVLRGEVLGEIVKLLQSVLHRNIAKGVTVNKRDTHLNTPLHLWASLELNTSSVNKYHESIAPGYTFTTLLKTILEHILDSGAKLNDRNGKEETPLHLCKTWTAVKLLMNCAANSNDLDSEGRPPLLLAAKKKIFCQSRERFYPDFSEDPEAFWRTAVEIGLNPWTVDRCGESVLSTLVESQSYVLAEALLKVACEKKYLESDTIAASLLNAVCKESSTRAHWKSSLVEIILNGRYIPLLYKEGEDSPLHFCCRHLVNSFSRVPDEIETTVHWTIAKLLLSYGVTNNKIPDKSGQTCLDIASSCPALKNLLLQPLAIGDIPKLIPWNSVSRRYEQLLAITAKRQESEHVDQFWYNKTPLGSGAFSLVFPGINERDGREVAIKRIEKLRMQRSEDKREITNLSALAYCEQVVGYVSFFEDKHFCYIVLELMEGNLDDYLANDNLLDIKENVKLCKDIVIGLNFLHNQNILHRDLKPTNILFKTHPKLCLKIADFGLSRRIDSTSTTVYGTNAGTRCWIAPEVLKATKDHSKSSDIFACGLILHYIMSAKKHPFAPATCDEKSELQINNETEANVIKNKIEGWNDELCPEVTDLVRKMLGDGRTRPSAAKSLAHPFFWSKKKMNDLLMAVANQPEFVCPRAKRSLPLSAVENVLEKRFGTIVKHTKWNDPSYAQMPTIYTEMMKNRKISYESFSVVELVRFIRNAYEHVFELQPPIRKQLLEEFVFLEYFPNLVMEVYKVVTTHGWDKREKIKSVINE